MCLDVPDLRNRVVQDRDPWTKSAASNAFTEVLHGDAIGIELDVCLLRGRVHVYVRGTWNALQYMFHGQCAATTARQAMHRNRDAF